MTTAHMRGCERDGWTRRQLLHRATLAGAGAVLGLRPEPVAAEPPPETAKLRLLWSPVICIAPQYVAEELLKGEGFTEVSYVNQPRWNEALASDEIDMSLLFGPPQVMQIAAGAPIVVLAGSHTGCVELLGSTRVRSTRDPKGKAVAAGQVGSDSHIFISMFVAHVGLDPQKDINWAMSQGSGGQLQLFLDGKVDAIMVGPPRSLELRAKGIGHALVNTTTDRPWSQYFCCLITARKEFVLRNPVATKRAMRALLKAGDVCALEPERVARLLMAKQLSPGYEYALQAMKELPYGRWRDYDPEEAVRFYALRLHDVGMIKSTPQKIIAQGTDWRFLHELKKELKGSKERDATFWAGLASLVQPASSV